MKPKERVQASVAHMEPDRVPIAYSATPEATERLKRHLAVDTEEALLEVLRVDFRCVQPHAKVTTYGDFFGVPLIADLGNGRFRDIWGIEYRRTDYGGGAYTEYERSPLAEMTSVQQLEEYPWPNVRDIWDFGHIRRDAERQRDYAVVFDGATLFQFCHALRGLARVLMDLYENPAMASAILEHVAQYWIEFGSLLLQEANGLVDYFVINDDYGSQRGPLFNPATWRQYLKPLVARVIGTYREYGVKIIFHSCGSVVQFIPDLIEMGAHVLDPIQVRAHGMQPVALKQAFGDRLCFRGAIDTQEALPYGSPETVRSEVRSRIRELAPGGGYILGPVHNLQPDVPPENILAMYEAAWEFGRYPLD